MTKTLKDICSIGKTIQLFSIPMIHWNLKSEIIEKDIVGKIVTKIKLSIKVEFKSESINRNIISFNINKINDSSRRIWSLYTPNSTCTKCINARCIK